MQKIVSVKEAIENSKELRTQGKQIVLAGGCFDILHGGHIEFLRKARDQADILFVLLESDGTVRKAKGKDRPVHTQFQRAKILSSLEWVNYIILLSSLKTHQEYDHLVTKIKPAIIATTKGDPFRFHKERQAKKIGALVRDVIERIPDKSTHSLVQLLSKQLCL